jgi:hypothetical protein
VIDAVEGLTAQDAHVAGYVVEEGRGLVVAVNKWDLVEDKTDRTFDQYVEWIRNEVPFLDFAPVVSISAKTGQRVGRVLELAIDIWGERRKRISTAELNKVLRAAFDRQQPPIVRGRRPKLFYGTQAGVAPADVRLLRRTRPAAIHFSYRRYIENQLREAFGLRRNADPARLPGPRIGAPAAAAHDEEAEDDRQDLGGEVHGATHLDGRSQHGSMSAGARVAVVGAGAWGTTLAVLIARTEPVVLLAQDPEAATRIDAARENVRRLPVSSSLRRSRSLRIRSPSATPISSSTRPRRLISARRLGGPPRRSLQPRTSCPS